MQLPIRSSLNSWRKCAGARLHSLVFPSSRSSIHGCQTGSFALKRGFLPPRLHGTPQITIEDAGSRIDGYGQSVLGAKADVHSGQASAAKVILSSSGLLGTCWRWGGELKSGRLLVGEFRSPFFTHVIPDAGYFVH